MDRAPFSSPTVLPWSFSIHLAEGWPVLPLSPVSCQCRDVSAAITLVLGRLLLGKLLCFPSVKCLFCSAHFPKIFLALSQLYQKRADCPSLRGNFCRVCSFVIIVKAGLDRLLMKVSWKKIKFMVKFQNLRILIFNIYQYFNIYQMYF